MKSRNLCAVGLVSALGAALLTLPVHAQQWRAVSGGGSQRTLEVSNSSTVSLPGVIARRGGQLRLLLAGGGEGGSATPSSCTDAAVQGGSGGDGGEVVEVDVQFSAGQCAAGLRIEVGSGGRGALQGGNASVSGEGGGDTSVFCDDALLAVAKGGGVRADAALGSKNSKGGRGGVVFNSLSSTAGDAVNQRGMSVKAAAEGGMGLQGFGSGAGGGGVSVAVSGYSVNSVGASTGKVLQVFNAPLGKAGYGAGNGAGPLEYAAATRFLAAEAGRMPGSGGGGGSLKCVEGVADGASLSAGAGAKGLVKMTWAE